MTAVANARQQHAQRPARGWPTVLLRVAGAGLLIATAAIHLDLYLTGYRTIPVIGWLFLLQVIAAFGLGLAVLALPGRTGHHGQPGAAGPGRHDHPNRRHPPAHLQRAPAVHLNRRQRPGQARGNDLNLNGGVWHEVPVSRP